MQPATYEVPIPDTDLLKEVVDHYETADQFARGVAVFRDKVVIPAHNELRYAGHHVIQSIDADTHQAGDVVNLRKAYRHCERAMYEASEAGLMHAARIILTVYKEYPGVVISEVVKDYHESWRRAETSEGHRGCRSCEPRIGAGPHPEVHGHVPRPEGTCRTTGSGA